MVCHTAHRAATERITGRNNNWYYMVACAHLAVVSAGWVMVYGGHDNYDNNKSPYYDLAVSQAWKFTMASYCISCDD